MVKPTPAMVHLRRCNCNHLSVQGTRAEKNNIFVGNGGNVMFLHAMNNRIGSFFCQTRKRRAQLLLSARFPKSYIGRFGIRT